jgi:tRNA pseudouridine55 synthase
MLLMFGLLNIHKPSGMTSRDVVNRVQRLLRGVKVGHAGTLDPLATGVLVVALGPATRLVEYVQRMPKTYVGTFLLGRASDTEDVEGNVIELDDPPRPTRQEIEAALPDFLGTIQQLPPAFSALKVQGRRAYDLARRGEQVELQPRPIEIARLALARYEYPELELEVCCGSGTYIRSLGRDIAQSLGTAAVMSALQRTAIGDFRLAEAMELEPLSVEIVARRLLSPRRAVVQLPTVALTGEEMRRIANGMTVGNRWSVEAAEIAAVDGLDRLVAILTPRGLGELGPARNFPS